MAGFEIDTSELRKLSTDLGKIPAKAVAPSEAVLRKAAQNLKEGMAAEFEGSPHFKRVGAAVSYERRGFARKIAYEIGPEIGRDAGSLGGIAVEGGANGGGGSVNIDGLLEPEAAQIEKHMLDVLGGLL
jgi:hypothetical protein